MEELEDENLLAWDSLDCEGTNFAYAMDSRFLKPSCGMALKVGVVSIFYSVLWITRVMCQKETTSRSQSMLLGRAGCRLE